MANEIKIFKNEKFGEVRVTMNKREEPMFCLADVCKALELTNPAMVKSRLSAKGISNTDTLTAGGVQSMTYINEANLYKCIFQSRKPEAEKFQDWVYEEVLPSIRKAGQYAVKPLTQGQMLVQMAQAYEAQERMLLEQQEKQRVMETQIHRLECATDVNYGFMAVLGYAKLHGIAVTRKLAATIGKAVSKYCRDNNIKFGSQKHPIFGNVNIYPDHALQAVFPKFFPNRIF